jgi:hypothetical protein
MRHAAIIATLAALALMAIPQVAMANHTHVLVLGNDSCVVLAKKGKENMVQLPEASFNNTTEPTTTANPHPLHVHVHRGQPGQVLTLAVIGTGGDPCAGSGDYVNQR